MLAPPLIAVIFDRLAAVPGTYWLLWFGSLLFSVSLIVLLRTRWGQSRPLQKCAVLSILVHALLACLAMTIRVVIGEGGGGSGVPIQVRLVEDSRGDTGPLRVPDIADTAMASPPALFQPAEPATPATDSASIAAADLTDALSAPALEQPPAQAESQPEDDASPSVEAIVSAEQDLRTDAALPVQPPTDIALPADDTVSDEHRQAPLPVAANNAEDSIKVTEAAPQSTDDSHATPDEREPVPTTGATAAPLAATAPTVSQYALRNAPGRMGLVELEGGNAQTEAAVAAALAWLARAQSTDGSWDAARFGAGEERAVLGQDRGGAGQSADTGVSALALLAFMGAGHSHQQGDYQDAVRRGLEFLLRSQAADGNLFGNATFYAQMYCHSMATFALAEAQAMSGDSRLSPAVTQAVEFSLRAQHAAKGGWRYKAGDAGDTSQLGWQMMALSSARRAGIDVPPHTWTRVDRFLKSVRRGARGGLASYRPDGPASASMTAEALYCRLLLEELGGEAVDEPSATEATEQLLAAPPAANRINLYYWYYGALALHHRQHASGPAQAAWRQWNEQLKAALVGSQITDGPYAGSWPTNTVWGGYGGRVYTTAMAAMCLEVYYRYATVVPAVPRRWTTARPAAQAATR